MAELLSNFYVISLIKSAIVAFVLLTALAYIQWIERKVLAHIQLRMGPSRVGPHGLLQPLADVIKLMTKEDLLPPHVNRFFYLLAPFMAVFLALIAISVIPFGPEVNIFGVRTWLQLTDLKIGILFVLAISSVSVYGVALAGWSSNNKYSLLGGLRSSAQMISYELPMALAIASPLLMLNTLSLRDMVNAQAGYYFGFLPQWTVFQGPWPQIISFVILLICGFAETNRVPFDLPEAENELVAGFHTEYSSIAGRGLPHRVLEHEVRRVLHGRILQHGDVHRDRNDAVPRRLDASVAGRVRVELPAGHHSGIRGADPALSRNEPGAAVRSHHDDDRRCDHFVARGCVPAACGAADPPAGVLVRVQDRHPAVPVHLDSGHAAALPL
jgi:NADH:ubiquinone oxidoreductase subunit H